MCPSAWDGDGDSGTQEITASASSIASSFEPRLSG